jgi:hypothetical protein
MLLGLLQGPLGHLDPRVRGKDYGDEGRSRTIALRKLIRLSSQLTQHSTRSSDNEGSSRWFVDSSPPQTPSKG